MHCFSSEIINHLKKIKAKQGMFRCERFSLVCFYIQISFLVSTTAGYCFHQNVGVFRQWIKYDGPQSCKLLNRTAKCYRLVKKKGVQSVTGTDVKSITLTDVVMSGKKNRSFSDLISLQLWASEDKQCQILVICVKLDISSTVEQHHSVWCCWSDFLSLGTSKDMGLSFSLEKFPPVSKETILDL